MALIGALGLLGLSCGESAEIMPGPKPPSATVGAGGEAGGGGGADHSGAAGEGGAAEPARCSLELAPPCLSSVPNLDVDRYCGFQCGDHCVRFDDSPDHCGGCDMACPERATCIDGLCGVEPSLLVAPAPGCVALRLVTDAGYLYWGDVGHGTIQRIEVAGGAVTTLASDVALALTKSDGPFSFNSDLDVMPTQLVARAGQVFFIATQDSLAQRDRPGSSILAVSADTSPQVLLSPELAATLGTPIQGLALSPDAKTLYFGADKRVYSMPSSGALDSSDIVLRGVSFGSPELGHVLALGVDATRVYYATDYDNTQLETFDLTSSCQPDPMGLSSCSRKVPRSHPFLLIEGPIVTASEAYWAEGASIYRWLTAPPDFEIGEPAGVGNALGIATGLAVSDGRVYAVNDAGLIVRVTLQPELTDVTRTAQALARGQNLPHSLVADGARLFWTTRDCDIQSLEDPGP